MRTKYFEGEVLDYPDITIYGDGGENSVDTDIGAIINAPGKEVLLGQVDIAELWRGLEIRDAKRVHIRALTVWQFMNDAVQICCSNVTIDTLNVWCTLGKEYSPENHPDILQIFALIRGTELSNIHIKNISVFIRNTPEHGGIHQTENDPIRDVHIGTESVDIDMDSTYPYWYSGTNGVDCSFGCEGMNVRGRKLRIQDVKRGGLPISRIAIAGMPTSDIIVGRGISMRKETEYSSQAMWVDDNHLVVPDTRTMSVVDKAFWSDRWPNFSHEEIQSGNHDIVIYMPALDALQAMRTELGYPLNVNSAYRNHKHHARVYRQSGRRVNWNSDHTTKAGRRINSSAFDVSIRSQSHGAELDALALKYGFNAIGRYNTFIHISMREPRWKGHIARWGRRWAS